MATIWYRALATALGRRAEPRGRNRRTATKVRRFCSHHMQQFEQPLATVVSHASIALQKQQAGVHAGMLDGKMMLSQFAMPTAARTAVYLL